MRPGRGLLLVVALLAAAPGCRLIDRIRGKDDKTDDPYRPPKGWADTAGRPKSDTAGDLRSEVKGLLSGIVLDPVGERVPYQDIEIELSDRDGAVAGAPVVVQTDKNGYFLARGLKANRAYTLTAKTKQGGRELVGQTVARTPSPTVRLQLRDDLRLPPDPPAGGGAVFEGPRKPALDPAGPTKPAARPLAGDEDLPMPKESVPPGPDARKGADWSPSGPAEKPTAPPPRKDLIADGPKPPDKPPLANIPNPMQPTLLPPPTISKFEGTAGDGFTLIDSMGRDRKFPAGRPGEMILLHFLTTGTEAARLAARSLNPVQARLISDGLEVIAVAVDDLAPSDRRSRAKAFADELRLNHAMYTESDALAGAVAKRFGVTTFPSLVLLDAAGKVLWQGRPDQLPEMEEWVRRRK